MRAVVALLCLGVATPAFAGPQTFGGGSLIIPMDIDYQDAGMLRAFGLVYQLLHAGVPVSWCVLPGKTLYTGSARNPLNPGNSVDFTATAKDVASGTSIGTHGYRGGPFVVDAANRDAALAVVTAFNAPACGTSCAAGKVCRISPDATCMPKVAVHEATAAFTATISKQLVSAPNIGINDDGNAPIALGYLNAAEIPDSLGNPFSDASPDMMTPADVAGPTTVSHHDGRLFGADGLPVYCQLMSMHWTVSRVQPNLEAIAEMREFLGFPTHLFAECQAVNMIEDDVSGHFATTDNGTGAPKASLTCPTPPSPGGGNGACAAPQPNATVTTAATNGLTFRSSDLPFAQVDGPFETVGGSEKAYGWATGSQYYDAGIVMIRNAVNPYSGDPLTDNGIDDLWMTSYANSVTRTCYITEDNRNNPCSGVGKVSYLGGHTYGSGATPISSNPASNGIRLFLNSLFEAGCTSAEGQPGITLGMAAPASVTQPQITFQLEWNNFGPGIAVGAAIVDVLPPGVDVVSASGGATWSNGTVTWALGNLAPDTFGIVSLTVSLPGHGTYVNQATLSYSIGTSVKSVASNQTTTIHAPGACGGMTCAPPLGPCQVTTCVQDTCGVAFAAVGTDPNGNCPALGGCSRSCDGKGGCTPCPGGSSLTHPRAMLVVDTSSSMTQHLTDTGDTGADGSSSYTSPALSRSVGSNPGFALYQGFQLGAGTPACTAPPSDGASYDGRNSHLFAAKAAVTSVVNGAGNVDWGLMRYIDGGPACPVGQPLLLTAGSCATDFDCARDEFCVAGKCGVDPNLCFARQYGATDTRGAATCGNHFSLPISFHGGCGTDAPLGSSLCATPQTCSADADCTGTMVERCALIGVGPARACRCGVEGTGCPAQYVCDAPTGRCVYNLDCRNPGGRILVDPAADGFSNLQVLPWVDGVEDRNDDGAGEPRNPELRANGETPLAGAIRTGTAWYRNLVDKGLDPRIQCRPYVLILVTDGADTCDIGSSGTVAAAQSFVAATMQGARSINRVYVVGVSITPSDVASLNAIAAAGGTGTARFSTSQRDIQLALSDIIQSAVMVEKCNDADDDCNGICDEPFPDVAITGAECSNRRPARTCDNGQLPGTHCHATGPYVCSADQLSQVCAAPTCATNADLCPVAETARGCNILDDDCNGVVDDCIPFVPNSCCDEGCVPQPEVCNGRDEDCDGIIDNNLQDPRIGVVGGPPCVPLPPGQQEPPCSPGVTVCRNGQVKCEGQVLPKVNQCDGIPVDCTGKPNVNGNCAEGFRCNQGICSPNCGTGEFPCAGGLVCDRKTNLCIPNACATQTCAQGLLCALDAEDVTKATCIDPCTRIVCPVGYTCSTGVCIDTTCRNLGCASGELCLGVPPSCRKDPCAGVSCAAGQFCTAEGTCAPVCPACSAGQVCQDGQCIEGPCATMVCPPSQRCAASGAVGMCVADRCPANGCGSGQVCCGGSCRTDSCLAVRCPAGSHCDYDSSCGASCFPDPLDNQVTMWTRGGGCDVSGTGSPGPFVLALLALGALLGRRRASDRGLPSRAAMVAAGLALLDGGCRQREVTVWVDEAGVPYAVVTDGSMPGDHPEVGSGVQDDGGAGRLDVLPCLPSNGGLEICDHADNDCNGRIDDVLPGRLAGDPNNCGACFNVCNLESLHQFGGCTGGDGAAPRCAASGCLPGWWDADGNAANGCEYACDQSSGGLEICDGLDNDCNGGTDDGLTAPGAMTCAAQGVCAGRNVTPSCGGVRGWICDYSAVPHVELDAAGNLLLLEIECDNLDNNCNGVTDLDGFPTLGKPCSAGVGVCQNSGVIACTSSTTAACGVAPSPERAADELCNGRDDNCDGQVDERSPMPGTSCAGVPCKGWTDPMVAVPTPLGGGVFYIYSFEAARPDATASSPGISSTRACSSAGALPWTNVTQPQAAAACAAVKDSTGVPMRLCAAKTSAPAYDEWGSACSGPGAAAGGGSTWSFSVNPGVYEAQICNDVNQVVPPALWPTGSPGGMSAARSKECYADWGLAGRLHDMSGNALEWTSTPIAVRSGSAASIVAGAAAGRMRVTGLSGMSDYDVGSLLTITGAGSAANRGAFPIAALVSQSSVDVVNAAAVVPDIANPAVAWEVAQFQVRGGAFDSPAGGTSCDFDFLILRPGFADANLGFRCCADNPP